MDYYASWSRSTAPKWVGVMMGSIFTLIIVVCAGMIVHLLRPPKHAPPPIVAAAVAQPKRSPAVPAPALAPTLIAQPAPIPASAPVATTASVAQQAPVVAQGNKNHSAHAHKRAILAKHDGKASRSSKSDLDRMLGL